jgi:nicotinamide phosphoribosyltransferase
VDGGKKSRPGKVTLARGHDGTVETIRLDQLGDRRELLEPVYDCGRLVRDQKFSEIRRMANATLYTNPVGV